MPTGSDFHTSFGPSAGHDFSRVLSGGMPLRLGPRNCGQSAVLGASAAGATAARASAATRPATVSRRDMRGLLAGGMRTRRGINREAASGDSGEVERLLERGQRLLAAGA